MRSLFTFLLLLLVPALLAAQKVVSVTVDGTINPASAGYIKSAMDKAAAGGAQCLLVRLNTPGGLLRSTRAIVGDILEAPLPVVVYVSPGGAHAGSAGVFITMAAHIAAMAPSTNIGAAHPVSTQGQMDPVLNEKATNDAVAFIRTIARKRNRNLEWAEDAVRNSVSITESEALDKGVVDLVAANEQQLLQQIDGRQVATASGTVTLRTAMATVEPLEMNLLERLLNLISDPNIAYILLMLGFYGLVFELGNPGAMVPGIVGVICLILAFYAMHALPVNYAGMALIVFALILFFLEIKIVSHGLLGLGGTLALVLGSSMLIRPESALEFARISWTVIAMVALMTAGFFLLLIGLAVRAQRAKVVTGVEGLVGAGGIALSGLAPLGKVQVHGEIWNAEAIAGNIGKGQKVRVTGIKNLKLFVAPVE